MSVMFIAIQLLIAGFFFFVAASTRWSEDATIASMLASAVALIALVFVRLDEPSQVAAYVVYGILVSWFFVARSLPVSFDIQARKDLGEPPIMCSCGRRTHGSWIHGLLPSIDAGSDVADILRLMN